jgi:hypothetical protein
MYAGRFVVVCDLALSVRVAEMFGDRPTF